MHALKTAMTEPEIHSVDDELLVDRARQDMDAFEAIYRRYSVPVYRMSLRACGDPDLADDLTSTVFLRAYERLGQYHERRVGTFRAWLFTIARNALLDHWRRSARNSLMTEEMPAVVDPDPGPEDIALSNMEIDDVMEILATLSERNRSIVELRLVGLTNREIAESLGISVSAVKSVQTRAYAHIRHQLLAKGDRP